MGLEKSKSKQEQEWQTLSVVGPRGEKASLKLGWSDFWKSYEAILEWEGIEYIGRDLTKKQAVEHSLNSFNRSVKKLSNWDFWELENKAILDEEDFNQVRRQD